MKKIIKEINKISSEKNLKKFLNKNTKEQLKIINKYFKEYYTIIWCWRRKLRCKKNQNNF